MPEAPSEYYTSRYSGEEIDRGIDGALQLGGATTKQQALRNIGGRPNRNLLDNWYFVGGGSQQGDGQFPINQRGQTSYNAKGGIMDRWVLETGGVTSGVAVTLSADGLVLNGNSAYQYTTVFQKLSALALSGQTYTLSVLLSNGTLVQASGQAAVEVMDWCRLQVTPTCFVRTVGLNRVDIVETAETPPIKALKFELGPTQTLAYQDEDGNWQLFETPDYGEELAKCQRYLVVYTMDGQRFCGVGHLDSASAVQSIIWTPVPMRIAPTISGDVSIYGVSNNLPGTNLTGAAIGPTGIRVNFSVSNAVNYPATVMIYTQNSLMLSAEL